MIIGKRSAVTGLIQTGGPDGFLNGVVVLETLVAEGQEIAVVGEAVEPRAGGRVGLAGEVVELVVPVLDGP